MSHDKTNKMWGGRFVLGQSEIMEKLNASIDFDKTLYKYDIHGSKVHADMLAKQGIITSEDNKAIQKGLDEIEAMIAKNSFEFSKSLEDIHMNVESKLKDIIGEPAGRLHTARSRNDQVAVDFKMYVRDVIEALIGLLKLLEEKILSKAAQHYDLMFPGCTHLQVAQPTTFGHHLMAYFEMFLRDIKRLRNAKDVMNECPLGCAALCGTPFNIDREYTAKKLGFAAPSRNSMDGVSDRDFAIELLSCIAIISVHLSRFAEECIIWVSKPYNYITLPEQYTTGSSIMPQKKNPDASELIKGKTGRIFGNLQTLLVVMKGLPLTYAKDMQEDKEPVFDSVDNVILCIQATTDIIAGIEVKKDNILRALKQGFPNATDLADYLVKQLGIPFRDAHHITGTLVKMAEDRGLALDELTLADMQSAHKGITQDVFSAIKIENSLKARNSYGGTAPDCVLRAIKEAEKRLAVIDGKN